MDSVMADCISLFKVSLSSEEPMSDDVA